MTTSIPTLSAINMQRSLRQITLSYENGESHELSYEYLRISSPSAEVKGHGPGQEVLQTGKEDVMIESIQPVGNYAVQIFFNDGHDSGIYSWQYLYQLATEKESLWQQYLAKLDAAGIKRKKTSIKNNIVEIFDPNNR